MDMRMMNTLEKLYKCFSNNGDVPSNEFQANEKYTGSGPAHPIGFKSDEVNAYMMNWFDSNIVDL